MGTDVDLVNCLSRRPPAHPAILMMADPNIPPVAIEDGWREED
jgi:hypothetical protein